MLSPSASQIQLQLQLANATVLTQLGQEAFWEGREGKEKEEDGRCKGRSAQQLGGAFPSP